MTESSLKEFYKTGNKDVLKSIPKHVQITKNTFYRMELPNGFGISYSYFR